MIRLNYEESQILSLTRGRATQQKVNYYRRMERFDLSTNSQLLFDFRLNMNYWIKHPNFMINVNVYLILTLVD